MMSNDQDPLQRELTLLDGSATEMLAAVTSIQDLVERLAMQASTRVVAVDNNKNRSCPLDSLRAKLEDPIDKARLDVLLAFTVNTLLFSKGRLVVRYVKPIQVSVAYPGFPR